MDEDFKGRLETPADAQRFIFAGNAIITLRSKKTTARFTFKITKSEDGKAFFVKVLVGPENTTDYQYLGHFMRGLYSHGRKSRITEDAPASKAFSFFVAQLDGLSFHEALEVWHEGRCCRCGRTLTVPASIKLGIGPECAGKMGVTIDDPTEQGDLPWEEEKPRTAEKKARRSPAKRSIESFLPSNADTVNIPLRRGRAAR